MSKPYSVRNPYTGEHDYSFDDPSPASNQADWAALPISERIAALEGFAKAIIRRQSELTAALTADTGRTYVAAREIDTLPYFIQRLGQDAPAALAPTPARPAGIPVIEGSTVRSPYGVVGNISPWNFPALVAGNAVMIKPSEVTPRWTDPMLEAINDCPEIAGVLDIVVGTGQAGAALIEHVDAVVFTGSVPTGRKVAEAAARRFIPAYLELGGKDPAVVLASADVNKAAEAVTFCSCQSTGQACQSLERAYVHESLFDTFLAKAIATAESLELNYPDINHGVIGPFIFAEQAQKVRDQIEAAVAAGATLHCGGEIIDHGGLWMRPAVMTGVTHDMELMQEETFGPVVPIIPFATEAEALALANDSKYGLSASVFAGTLDEAREFGSKIRAGAISLNDASLTALIHEFDHDSFGYSGLGKSRAGLSAYTRFTREQSLMANLSGEPLLITQLANP
jgi:acyl-CoA reductase-like NAD-dependent aldehyde dehydrogenase